MKARGRTRRGGALGAHLRVHRALPAHAGLGSGTQLALAIGRALADLHGFEADTRGRRRIWVMQLADHLPQLGLDPDRDGFSFGTEFFAVVLRVRPGPMAERDAVTERWAALLRGAHATGGQPIFAGVEVVDLAPHLAVAGDPREGGAWPDLDPADGPPSHGVGRVVGGIRHEPDGVGS